MDLFKVSPETKMTFEFLHHVDIDDEKFYNLVYKHSLRVTGMITTLVKEVIEDLSDNTTCFYCYCYSFVFYFNFIFLFLISATV